MIIAKYEGSMGEVFYADFLEHDGVDSKSIVLHLVSQLEENNGGTIAPSEVEFFRCEELKLEVTYKLHGV